jgi:hypothetical protein
MQCKHSRGLSYRKHMRPLYDLDLTENDMIAAPSSFVFTSGPVSELATWACLENLKP